MFESVLQNAFPAERDEPDPFYMSSSNLLKNKWARVSVFAIVRRLREQRWDMVPERDQYVYLYKFLSTWVRLGENAAMRKLLSSCDIKLQI